VLTLPFRLTDLEIRVDCAIGCAMLSPRVSSAEEVLRNAQVALKRAKRVGMTQVYEPVQAQAVRRRSAWRRAAPGHRGGGADAGLPAAHRAAHWSGLRVRGARALEERSGRTDFAGRLHPGR
jgi:hypothetical protein